MLHMNIQGNSVELMVLIDPNKLKEHPRMKKKAGVIGKALKITV